VPDALGRLLGRYLAQREPDENLRRFFARHSNTQLREFLAGEKVEEVPRDLPAEHVMAHSAGGIGD
jgi:sulfite reductase (ferredoxin)